MDEKQPEAQQAPLHSEEEVKSAIAMFAHLATQLVNRPDVSLDFAMQGIAAEMQGQTVCLQIFESIVDPELRKEGIAWGVRFVDCTSTTEKAEVMNITARDPQTLRTLGEKVMWALLVGLLDSALARTCLGLLGVEVVAHSRVQPRAPEPKIIV